MWRRAIAATICVMMLIGIGTVFFVDMPFIAEHTANVIDTQRRDTTLDTTAATEAVQFSNEGMVTVASKKEETDSSIAIVTDAPATPKSALVVEKSLASDGTVTHTISYSYDTTALINEIHTLSNQQREAAGQSSLAFDVKLAALALARSTDMAQHNYLSHTAQDGCDLSCRFASTEYETLVWGENLAEYEPYTRLTPERLAKEFVTRWLASSEHRRNLLSDQFTHHGIGVALNGKRIVITVIFARPK